MALHIIFSARVSLLPIVQFALVELNWREEAAFQLCGNKAYFIGVLPRRYLIVTPGTGTINGIATKEALYRPLPCTSETGTENAFQKVL